MQKHAIRLAVISSVLTFAATASAQQRSWPPLDSESVPAQPAPVPVVVVQQSAPGAAAEVETQTVSETEVTVATQSTGTGPEVAPPGDTNVHVQVGVSSEAPPIPGRSANSPPAAAPASAEGPPGDEPHLDRFLHGFRLGYLYINDIDGPADSENPSSPTYADRYGIRSPHMFMMGYEAMVRLFGHDWLNVLLIGNVLIAGLEQSRFFPSLNFLLGFEFNQTAQIGVGLSLTPTKDNPGHLMIAAGWTPRVGEFYLPVHFFFVPDINGHHKMGVTLGVTF